MPPERVSWFQSQPEPSLAMIEAAAFDRSRPIIDIGGGASRLVDALITAGCTDLSVLDIAPQAMDHARARLAENADRVQWITADVTRWTPPRQYALWHDRAVFHFLTDPADQARYAEALRAALAPDGQAIIATFALDGPEKCSGLTVQRHDEASLIEALGGGFQVIESSKEDHKTPGGTIQRFIWCRLGRV